MNTFYSKLVIIFSIAMLTNLAYSQENNAITCSDGIDNDGDGNIDCNDDECLAFSDQACNICTEGITFADEVIDYQSGCTVADPNPDGALGIADYDGSTTDSPSFVFLGEGGFIKLGFTDNLLTNSGDTNNDVWIFEVGPSVETSELALRPANNFTETQLINNNISDEDADGFYEIGSIGGSTNGVDIDNILSGYEQGTLVFDAIEIKDVATTACTNSTPGADIDAVCALSSVTLSTKNVNLKNYFIKVFPNPASQKISIQSNIRLNDDIPFEIFNLQGQSLLKGLVNDQKEIVLDNLHLGLYYLTLKINSQLITKKILKI